MYSILAITQQSLTYCGNLPEKLHGDIKVAIVDAAYHTDDVSQHERINELCTEIERAVGNKGITLLPLPPW